MQMNDRVLYLLRQSLDLFLRRSFYLLSLAFLSLGISVFQSLFEDLPILFPNYIHVIHCCDLKCMFSYFFL